MAVFIHTPLPTSFSQPTWLYLFTHHYQHLSANLHHPQGKLYVK